MKKRDRLFQITANTVLILLTLSCILPFMLLIISSFTDEYALLRDGYSFFPKKLSFAAYQYLLLDSDVIFRGYIISVGVTVIGTLINVFLTTLFAYPLSRKDLPGRRFFSFFIYVTMLFNGGLVPTYIMWTQTFKIRNTWFAYIVPGLMMSTFFIIMMRTYFTTNIPDTVIEAARIDGAKEFRILFKVVFPMAVPIMATVTLLVGIRYWNDWMNGLYYINDSKKFSIQALLQRILMDVRFLQQTQGAGNLNIDLVVPSTAIRMAIATMGVLPVLVLYSFLQKYFVKGITVGAIKG